MLTDHDIRLAERDAQLPGMPLLLDAGAVEQCLRERGSSDFEGLRLLYIRYKPGVNLLAGYGREGVVELYGKAFRPNDHAKLAKARQKDPGSVSGSRERVILDDPAVVLSVFPDDAKMRTLERLTVHREIRRMARMAGSSRRRSMIAPVRYKPERRFVGRLYDRRGDSACIKTFTRDGFANALAGWRAVAECDQFSTPRLLGDVSHLSTLVIEWVDGQSLHDLLRTSAWEPAHVEEAGRSLALLHRLEPNSRPHHAAAAMTQTNSDLHRALVVLLPERKTQLAELFRKAHRVVAELSARTRFLHGDFNAEQILVTDEGVRLIDFDRTAMGPAKIDLATFAAHLELDGCCGRIDPDDIESIVTTLRSGYLAAGGRLRTSLSALTAVVLLQLASTPFRRGHKEWPDQMCQILDRSCQLLGIGGRQQMRGDASRSASHSVQPGHAPDGNQAAASQPEDVGRERGHASARTQSTFSDEASSTLESHASTSVDSKSIAASSDPLENEMLTRALDPDYVSGLLRLSGFVPDIAPDTDAVTITSAKLIKRRSGKRFVVNYRRAGIQSDLVGKVRLKGVDRRSFGVVQELHDLGFAHGGGRPFAVPRPVAIVDDLNMSLYEKVRSGGGAEALLSERGEDVAWRVGRALASLHSVRAFTERHHTLPEEIAILTECLDRFASSHSDYAVRTSEILSRCRHLVSDSPYSLTAIHRDFHPGNILDDAGQIYVIDFDLYSLGDPAIDAGNFIGHLIELGIRNYEDRDALDGLVRAFRAGYRDADGPADRRRIQSFATLTLARHIYLSTVRPGRSSTTDELIDCCEMRLRRAAAA